MGPDQHNRLRANDFVIDAAVGDVSEPSACIVPGDLQRDMVVPSSRLNLTIGGGLGAIHTSEDQQLILCFCGEVFGSNAIGDSRALIDQYRINGIRFVRELNGSFCLALFDRMNSTLIVATDRLNSKKIYFSQEKSHAIFSTSIYLQPTAGCKVDKASVAAYLANGSLINNRTLFEGIETLEGACVYRYGPDGLTKSTYWDYHFDNSYSSKSLRALQAEMSDLLIAAVKRRLPAKGAPLLSLSGGYDSSAILGIMGESLRLRDVRCFSYGYGEAKNLSDEYLSQQMASLYGYNVRQVASFGGDLGAIIKRNAILGQGVSHFCHEVDAWIELGCDSQLNEPLCLFAGDECLGWKDRPARNFTDVLRLVSIVGFESIGWLETYIDNSMLGEMDALLRAEIEKAKSSCPAAADWHDIKDYLYLKHRMNHVILPWRENFCGHFFSVANPLLDNSILEFMQKVPSARRKGKQLFIQTVTAMFPKLFALKRAESSSFTSFWNRELFVQKKEIEGLLGGTSNPLDEVFSPEALRKILADYTFAPASENSRGWPRRALDKTLQVVGLRTLLVSKVRVGAPPPLPVAKFLERALAIRAFLALSRQ